MQTIMAIDPGIVNGAMCIINKDNLKDYKVWESFRLSYSGKAQKPTIIKDLKTYCNDRLKPLIQKHNVVEMVIETQIPRSAKLNGFEYFIAGWADGLNIPLTHIAPKQFTQAYPEIPKQRKQKKLKTQEIVHDYLDIEEATFIYNKKEIEDKADAYMLVLVHDKIQKTKQCKKKKRKL